MNNYARILKELEEELMNCIYDSGHTCGNIDIIENIQNEVRKVVESYIASCDSDFLDLYNL